MYTYKEYLKLQEHGFMSRDERLAIRNTEQIRIAVMRKHNPESYNH